MTRDITPAAHYYGNLVALITTLNDDGSTGITPVSSTFALGNQFVVGISELNQGFHNITRTGEAVINFASPLMVPGIERISLTTGRESVPEEKKPLFRHCPDKWQLAGFAREESRTVSPHSIAESPIVIESTLSQTMSLGETMWALHLTVARVRVHDELVLDPTHVDIRAWEPVLYTFRHYFGRGAHLGANARADQSY